MPAIDDYKFTVKTLLEKVSRLDEIASRVEKTPAYKKDRALLKVMAEGMDDWLSQYTELIQKIASHNAKQSIEEDLQPLIVNFETLFYNAKAIVKSVSSSEENLNQSLINPTAQQSPFGVQLPQLNLIKFSGDLKTWNNFSDLFTATIDSNVQLSNIQKHMYLRSALTGEALAIVSHLPLTGPNYTTCWETLKSHYDDTHLLTNSYLEALFNISIPNRDASQLRLVSSQLSEYVGALAAIGHPVEGWAVPVLFILSKKLPAHLRERWEKRVLNNPMPSIKQFMEFLMEEARVIEASKSTESTSDTYNQKSKFSGKPKMGKGSTNFLLSDTTEKCSYCSNSHMISQCNNFRRIPINKRFEFAKSNRLCLNCLSTGHFSRFCLKSNACKHCTSKHHSLLHYVKTVEDPGHARDLEVANLHPTGIPQQSLQTYATATETVLLATAQAYVQDQMGQYKPDDYYSSTVYGMAKTALGVAKEKVRCLFQPTRNVELQIDALVVDQITNCPSVTLQSKNWKHLEGLTLADPNYCKPGSVDVLLGAEWFGHVVLGATVVGPKGSPSAIDTIWGYCLMGRIQQPSQGIQSLCISCDDKIDNILRQFWEVEETLSMKPWSEEDQACEDHFTATTTRLDSGRYVVELPFRRNAESLRDSRAAACRQFYSLEKRLMRNPKLRELYVEFMNDFIEQGHMVIAPPCPTSVGSAYFIPHHCIFRDNGDISKFRVVFDASMATEGGPSLNQTLLAGPKLQADIVHILILFRLHEVVLVTDIRQMYRNILVTEKHRHFQRILWRQKPEDPLLEYWLITVTYGVSASPFLAIRTIQQLAVDEGSSFPKAAEAIRSATYMDDVTLSIPSVEEGLQLQTELINLLKLGGFELRKWMSNKAELLETVPKEHCAINLPLIFENGPDTVAKVLGLTWNPTTDIFSYQISQKSMQVTKRIILSEIAKLYDPLGFLCPVILIGKCLMRSLWQLGLDWDECPSHEIVLRWNRFREEMAELESFKLPRWLNIKPTAKVELHGFADSSQLGYAAVLYLRTEDSDGYGTLSLLLAKSKVAPLKVVTLPRLELCGVHLATLLLEKVLKTLKPRCEISSVTIWSDSMIALHWIKSSPHRWKTYVANKVSAIQTILSPNNFRHVPTDLNPADCASRGLFPKELMHHPMWLAGPAWLKEPSSSWLPNKFETPEMFNEESKIALNVMKQELPPQTHFAPFDRISSFSLLKRVIAWCCRYKHNLRYRNDRRSGGLTVHELTEALIVCIKIVQEDTFKVDINRLQQGRSPTNSLRKLNPFLDDNRLIRVGGRLKHAPLPFATKYPILLPKVHPFTTLIIDYYHKLYLHPGPSNLHAIIQTQFWIMSGREAIRRRILRCVNCFRSNPVTLQPSMGNLPSQRVHSLKAFESCGVDYGGPFEITLGNLRKARVYKAYICLFVCFATKAIHLELVSELTTDAFLAALMRFVARRGTIKEIFSDCGTNFVGSKRKLEEWANFVASEEVTEIVSRNLANQGINWHLNPPYSPHMGGLWEAGIKSVKKLLYRVIGTQKLTYEEFYTVLVQIEATLNSRPLTPLSSDPNDLEALTPGHFLLNEVPCILLAPHESLGLKQRWKLLDSLLRSFWKRWSVDYLHTLQQRHKWNKIEEPLKEGAMVVIKEDHVSPLHWRLGRIVKPIYGSDGISRVAEIKTGRGTITRAIAKLCLLPVQ